MALDATVGGGTANSYATVSQASTLLLERLNTEPWYATASTEQLSLTAKREAALITATRLLDQQVAWKGSPATTTQSLAWPRQGMVDAFGRDVATTVVPTEIQRATAYYALALLRDDREAPGSTDDRVRRRQLGQTEIEYWQPGSTTGQTPVTQMPAEVRQMLRPYGVVVGSVGVTLLRA